MIIHEIQLIKSKLVLTLTAFDTSQMIFKICEVADYSKSSRSNAKGVETIWIHKFSTSNNTEKEILQALSVLVQIAKEKAINDHDFLMRLLNDLK
ncbi:Unknown protein sequence [Pseudomonas amygdali pv. eriobotryae]|uniref:Uncharacterized protein n=1 Tax=Pseudomonas amygdali pv. eriobotryae TaxID=129137 RepID=A0A0P9QD93_PSEA0|nr:hypothetical protein [Pseudomonas amygdali]KPX26144.1 Unknown protein sequence [Pseudomonas amygdali pv. eriobotryae]KWS79758.1 hypothetical protein AL052_25595 [Pseudomonas amygdali pv. eriobotryae]